MSLTQPQPADACTPQHTPVGRGFESWLGYFHHANDYYNEGLPITSIGTLNVCDNRFTDLWDTSGPAVAQHTSGLYEEDLFTNRTLSVIAAHDASNVSAPLFLLHAFHLVHTPLQVPASALARFPDIDDKKRQLVAAMAGYLDDQVAKIVAALKANTKMWDDTLLIFSADVSSPSFCFHSSARKSLFVVS